MEYQSLKTSDCNLFAFCLLGGCLVGNVAEAQCSLGGSFLQANEANPIPYRDRRRPPRYPVSDGIKVFSNFQDGAETHWGSVLCLRWEGKDALNYLSRR